MLKVNCQNDSFLVCYNFNNKKTIIDKRRNWSNDKRRNGATTNGGLLLNSKTCNTHVLKRPSELQNNALLSFSIRCQLLLEYVSSS